MDLGGWIVLGAWVLVFVAFVALFLIIVAVSQRLHLLRRAMARLEQKTKAASALAEQLQTKALWKRRMVLDTIS